jgi:hypothetical protein
MKNSNDILVSKEGLASFFQWMKTEHGFREEQTKPYTFNPAPFLANKKAVQQGYLTSEPYTIEKTAASSPWCICSPTTASRPTRPPSRPAAISWRRTPTS